MFFSSAELCLTAVLRTEHWGFFFLFHLVHTLWLIVISLPGQFTYLTAEALTTPTLLYCMSSSSNQHPHTYSIYNHLCHSKKHTQFYWVKVRIYAFSYVTNSLSFKIILWQPWYELSLCTQPDNIFSIKTMFE